MRPGLHLLHKPAGPTSFSLVQAAINSVASQTKPPKIIHGGTLDPFASGLLILLVGPAVKLFEHLHPIPKTYLATVKWGTQTDNDDPQGQPVFAGDASHLTPDLLDQTLASYLGWHEQIPPATSNKRIAGERAYQKAHRGESVTLPPIQVFLHSAKWLSHNLPHTSQLQITVKGGYYIRSLARDMGQKLNCGAHLSTLQRTHIGPYEDPGPTPDSPPINFIPHPSSFILSPDSPPIPFILHPSSFILSPDILPWLPSRNLTDTEIGQLRRNQPILQNTIQNPTWPLPDQFPIIQNPPIRAYHQSKLVYLLKKETHYLTVQTPLGKGL